MVEKRIQPFAPKLKAIMNDKGISAAELSRDSGLSRATITKLRNGERYDPGRSSLILISRVLGCSVEELC